MPVGTGLSGAGRGIVWNAMTGCWDLQAATQRGAAIATTRIDKRRILRFPLPLVRLVGWWAQRLVILRGRAIDQCQISRFVMVRSFITSGRVMGRLCSSCRD